MSQKILKLCLLLFHDFFNLCFNILGVPLLVLKVLGPFDLVISEELLEVAMIHLQTLKVVL